MQKPSGPVSSFSTVRSRQITQPMKNRVSLID
jgi:hypothetical protein